MFLDFDGTITREDVTDSILEAFAEPGWLEIEEEWSAGRIGSRECLRGQIALVHATPAKLDAVLDAIAIDDGFVRLMQSCATAGLPVHIVSDGFDYCIRRILTRSLARIPFVDEATVVSNRLSSDGLRWRADFPSPPCGHGCGTCKPAAMGRLNTLGAPAIFVGDGLSDQYAAAHADIVFAKGALRTFCETRQIACIAYETLADVARYVETSWPDAHGDVLRGIASSAD